MLETTIFKSLVYFCLYVDLDDCLFVYLFAYRLVACLPNKMDSMEYVISTKLYVDHRNLCPDHIGMYFLGGETWRWTSSKSIALVPSYVKYRHITFSGNSTTDPRRI